MGLLFILLIQSIRVGIKSPEERSRIIPTVGFLGSQDFLKRDLHRYEWPNSLSYYFSSSCVI